MLSTSKQFRNPLIYCGGARPHGIISPKNAVWIRFRSDNGTTGKGFYISYMSVGKILYIEKCFPFVFINKHKQNTNSSDKHFKNMHFMNLSFRILVNIHFQKYFLNQKLFMTGQTEF